MQIAPTVPPSLLPARGIRALEVAIARIDSAGSRLGAATPARVSMDVSNIDAMFQQGQTIARAHLAVDHPLQGAIAQAMTGMDLLRRELRRTDVVPVDRIAALLADWRTTAEAGITALQVIAPPFSASR